MKLILKSLINSLCKYKSIRQSTIIILCETNNKKNGFQSRKKSGTVEKIIIGATVAGFLGYYLHDKRRNFVYAKTEKNNSQNENVAGIFKKGLPFYSLDEIGKHNSMESRVWVTYKEGVYDVTDYVHAHPGGDQILMAAGSSVEPFWVLYGIHKNLFVYKILETFRIGNVRKEDVSELANDMSDPYVTDPLRHAALIPASKKPFNGEVSPALLVENFITPNEFFYVRNHLPVPEIDPGTYELEIEVEGKDQTITFTLDELKKLPNITITSTIMCAGNRRADMMKVKPVKGLNWGCAAIGNAKWTGVRLRDILKIAGVSEENKEYKHVQFEGVDLDVTGTTYGGSIPIWKALDEKGDVLLVYEMNGVPLPRDHGYPIRVVVPGIAGARNVKWLGKIIVSDKESDAHWQQNDYKGFSPSTDYDTVDFSKSPAVQELPVTSAICQPSEGDTVNVVDGHIFVKGYAWSGGGQKIVRVDITADEGNTWHVANLDFQDTALPPHHWAWTLWSVKIPVGKDVKNVEIWAKAVDSCYNTQPESFKNIWNFRGVLNNAYHRVKVNLKH